MKVMFLESAVFYLFLALLLGASPLLSQHISVTFEGRNFSKGPSASQVRELANSILRERVSRYSRCDVRLTGQSTVCDLHFVLRRAHIKTVSGKLIVKELSGRIPVGNLLVLLQGRLRWPESMLVKDVRVKIDSNRLAKWLSSSTSISTVRSLPSGASCRSNLRSVKSQKERKTIVRHFLDEGCSVSFGGGRANIRNANPKNILYLSGVLPDVLGSMDVEAVGVPVALPSGAIGYDCSLVIADGVLKPQGPERYLAAAEFSRTMELLRSELDDALVCRSFVNDSHIADDGALEMRGVAVVGMFGHLDRVRRRGRAAKRFQGQTIKLNIFR